MVSNWSINLISSSYQEFITYRQPMATASCTLKACTRILRCRPFVHPSNIPGILSVYLGHSQILFLDINEVLRPRLLEICEGWHAKKKLNLSRRAADSVSSSNPKPTDLWGADSVRKDTDICTGPPDMKDLRKLFQKVLRKSDVGPLGRIVIPKKEAEQYLPRIGEKQGRALSIRDVVSNNVWGMKYKLLPLYWVNNRSRMYLFESADQEALLEKIN